MALLSSALDHYERQQRIARRGLIASRQARYGSLANLARVVALAQLAAAQDSADSAPAMLAEQGVRDDPVALVVPGSVAGVASDGRDLLGLLDFIRRPDIPAKRFDRAVLSQIRDAGRAGGSLAMASRPDVAGYTRVLVGKSCSRCAILAGRFYRWNEGFQRHPNCFPAGVVVSGPQSQNATRRWFEGELVVLATASGQELPVTGNHPILTRRGWVPANLIEEGDEVVRSTRPKGAAALVIPDHDQMPAHIEDVWRSLEVFGIDAVPSSPEDFHGDGQAGQVDIVGSDRSLVDHWLSALVQPAGEVNLASALWSTSGLTSERSAKLVKAFDALSADGGMGGIDLACTLLGGHSGGAHLPRLGSPADFNSRIAQMLDEGWAGYVNLAGEGQGALATFVPGCDLLDGQVYDGPGPRWDAPAGPLTEESRGAYASRGADLLSRLSGQVELDRVVKVARRHFSGHVYSLTSSEGWHVANNLIVSNCDCKHQPATDRTSSDLTTDPREYFDSLSAQDQDRVFTKSGAEAIRHGADMSQVVNARAGMSTAQARPRGRGDRWTAQGRLEARSVYGRPAYTTTEGTTRGSVGRAAMIANLRNASKAPRLMPETILAIASDRVEAIKLLRAYGYITS